MSDELQLSITDTDLISSFLEEMREQIDILDQGLIRLERDAENSLILQEIFRAAHTLKGSSGAMGLKSVAELTHAMETVLDRLQKGTLAPGNTVIDVLMQGLDILKETDYEIEHGQFNSYTSAHADMIAAELMDLTASDVLPEPKPDDQYDETIPELPEDCVGILVEFSPDCQMPGVRAFMVCQALESYGFIQRCIPSRDDIDKGSVNRRILLIVQSGDDEDALQSAVMRISEIAKVLIMRGSSASGMRLNMPIGDSEPLPQEPDVSALPVLENTLLEQRTTDNIQIGQTVRVKVDILDKMLNLVGELALDRTRLSDLKEKIRGQVSDDTLIYEYDSALHHLVTVLGELHEHVLTARMLPVSHLFKRFPRLVRDLSRSLGKEIDLQIEGEAEKLDRSVIEKLVDPITHLLRNSVDHGIETREERERAGKQALGTIYLSASRHDDRLIIEVKDDGSGIDIDRLKARAVESGVISAQKASNLNSQSALALIFISGLSTVSKVSDISGRGVGMDVVRKNIESLGGTISMESVRGAGTRFRINIPLTVAFIPALLVCAGSVEFAIPYSLVEETITVERELVQESDGTQIFRWYDKYVPIIFLDKELSGCGETLSGSYLRIVVVGCENQLIGISVDSIIGHQEIVVRPISRYLGAIPGLAGATILGNGRVALILDVNYLSEKLVPRAVTCQDCHDGYTNPSILIQHGEKDDMSGQGRTVDHLPLTINASVRHVERHIRRIPNGSSNPAE